jgi:hypothetical protein
MGSFYDGLGATADDPVVEMAFWYSATVALTALQTLSPQINLNADSDFMALWLVATSTGTFSINFVDNATGRAFTNAGSQGSSQTPQINNANLFGTAQLPFPMLPPYVFQRNGSIGLTITDSSNSSNTVQIVFAGKKIFPSRTSGAAGDVVHAS